MSRPKRSMPRIIIGLFLALVVGAIGLYDGRAIAQKPEASGDWVAEIEKIFIRSEERRVGKECRL